LIIKDNPQMHKDITDHLVKKYQLHEKRINLPDVHLSSLVYCLTKAYWDDKQHLPPTKREVMLFALGYGLQSEMTPAEAETPVIINSGIVYRPDLVLRGRLGEMKTTRAKSGSPLSETWMEYMMGGCFIKNTNEYDLAVLRVISAELETYTIEFTDDELCDNWEYLIQRRDIVVDSLTHSIMPDPFKYNKEWECNGCRYRIWCDMVAAEEPEANEAESETQPDGNTEAAE